MNDKRDPSVTIEPLAVRPATASKLMDCGRSRIYELIREGRLEVVRIDSDQRVTVRSIKRLLGVE